MPSAPEKHDAPGNRLDVARYDHSAVEDCLEVWKTLRLPVKQLPAFVEALSGMAKEQEFSPDIAAAVNIVLKAPVLRTPETQKREEDLRDYWADELHTDPDELKEKAKEMSQDDELNFQIRSHVQVKAELIGLHMQEEGFGSRDILNPIMGFIGLAVARVDTPGEEPCITPKLGFKFSPGQTLWCQLKNKRFWKLNLALSPEVAKVCIGDHIIIDKSLRGNHQYVMLPATRRFGDGAKAPQLEPEGKLSDIFGANEVCQTSRSNILRYFCGDSVDDKRVTVSFRSYPVRMLEEPGGDVPKAISGPADKMIPKFKKGWKPSETDAHGFFARDDVNECTDVRARSGGYSLIAIGHKCHSVKHVRNNPPKNICIDSYPWWEVPGSASVVEPDGSYLVLLREPGATRDKGETKVLEKVLYSDSVQPTELSARELEEVRKKHIEELELVRQSCESQVKQLRGEGASIELLDCTALEQLLEVTNVASGRIAQCLQRKRAQSESCKICFDADVEVVLRSCGHFAMCERCALQVEHCPICRGDASDYTKVFR